MTPTATRADVDALAQRWPSLADMPLVGVDMWPDEEISGLGDQARFDSSETPLQLTETMLTGEPVAQHDDDLAV